MPPNPEALAVEFMLLDSVEYDNNVPAEQCARILCQNRTLLGSKMQSAGPNHLHKVPFRYDPKRGAYIAKLPDLYVTKNAKHVRSKLELRHVRDPGFRLLARCVDSLSHDAVRKDVAPVVSHAFRVVVEKAGAGNKGTPMLDDPVNVLPGIGPETLQKLMDVGATAAAKGHSVPFARISTVAHMLELLSWCRNTNFPLEAMRSTLNVPRPSWNEIIVKVEGAKLNDSYMRIWYCGQQCEKGLLFACNGGVIQASEPKGLLMRVDNDKYDYTVMEMYELMSMRELETYFKEHREIYDGIRGLWTEAMECWHRQGHPGWAIWRIPSEEFLSTWVIPNDERRFAPLPVLGGWDPTQGRPERRVVMQVQQRKPGMERASPVAVPVERDLVPQGPPAALRVDPKLEAAPVSPFLIAAGNPYPGEDQRPAAPQIPTREPAAAVGAVPPDSDMAAILSTLSNRLSDMRVEDVPPPGLSGLPPATFSHLPFPCLSSLPEHYFSGPTEPLPSRISDIVLRCLQQRDISETITAAIPAGNIHTGLGTTEITQEVLGNKISGIASAVLSQLRSAEFGSWITGDYDPLYSIPTGLFQSLGDSHMQGLQNHQLDNHNNHNHRGHGGDDY
eukprot:jgi/Botrbrau1/13891/Bobra.0056s0120.1